jgi:hypothetical protein
MPLSTALETRNVFELSRLEGRPRSVVVLMSMKSAATTAVRLEARRRHRKRRL